MEILMLKSIIPELKTLLEMLNSIFEVAGERIRQLEDRSMKIMQSEEHR